mgnify:FL=1
MPQANDIVIKDDKEQSKTFSLVSPASSDKTVALFSLKEGDSGLVYPRITVSSWRTNAGRKVDVRLTVPEPDKKDTQRAIANVVMHLQMSIPDVVSEGQKLRASAFVANLVNHTLIKQCLKDGVSPT